MITSIIDSHDTAEKKAAYTLDLKELYTTDPSLPKEPYSFLKGYARGYHGPGGNNVSAKRSKSNFHYAYCSTSNPNYHGCRKCDFYWNQFIYKDIDMVKEARQAAYEDEKSVKPPKEPRLAKVVEAMCDAILAHETDDEEEKEEKMEEDEVAVDVLGDMAAQEEDQE